MVTVRSQTGKRAIQRWDNVFRAASAEPRRQIIISLNDVPPDRAVPLPESALNPNVPADLENVRRELTHRHLPMLTDFGFVRWQTDPLRVSRGPRFDEIAIVFESLQETATEVPDSLVIGCQRLEQERNGATED